MRSPLSHPLRRLRTAFSPSPSHRRRQTASPDPVRHSPTSSSSPLSHPGSSSPSTSSLDIYHDGPPRHPSASHNINTINGTTAHPLPVPTSAKARAILPPSTPTDLSMSPTDTVSNASFSPASAVSVSSFSPSSAFASGGFHVSQGAKYASHRLRGMLAIRRQPSGLDLELEEEKRDFGGVLERVIEPRPDVGTRVVAGWEMVLEGKA
ncbi:hypothetical protein P152DRAFT_265537 [Eremomyces bilateralis CBS 781.70]|uniref:Uncharacterized protein n=1 Tax=Eremomyces bilateralis CBS 781.70 TaxID=1392243 RepID=A0A6G1G893_9PEZI|nr:uncharacterized protein P152DRAFT_265537 [Eremomyces bilateralis CBS 781.70]KAF1814254.1 hypothetical protein P152DRAFT_265537 [Eremomyces bilateralis CBS 781.70]